MAIYYLALLAIWSPGIVHGGSKSINPPALAEYSTRPARTAAAAVGPRVVRLIKSQLN